MASINKAIIVGHLGKDPDIRTMQSGSKMARFSVATSKSWKDKTSGERKTATQWHNVAILNQGLVTVVERYLKKGAPVYIEGEMQTRKYTDRQNIERYTTEIVLQPFNGELVMLSSGSGGAPPPPDSEDDYGDESSMTQEQIDEIPF